MSMIEIASIKFLRNEYKITNRAICKNELPRNQRGSAEAYWNCWHASCTSPKSYPLHAPTAAAATVVAAMLTNPALRADVAAWERRLIALSVLTPEVQAPADSWDMLEAALDRTPRRTLDRLLDDGTWNNVSPGVTRKLLWNNETFLLRVAPGGTIRPHGHARVEHCVVVEGSMVIEGRSFGPGDYHGIQAGIPHKAIHAPDGLLLLIRQGD